jgi:hypothetical protein
MTTETCRIYTYRGVPTSLAVGGCECDVPHLDTPGESVTAALAELGYEPLPWGCWVNRTLSILAVRRRATP